MDSRSSQQTTTVRTYNPNVRVANWNEELCLEEDILKDFLGKQEAGTLLIQRSQALMQTLLAKTELTKNEDDIVTHGSNIMIINPGRQGLNPETEGGKKAEDLPKKLLAGRNCSSISLNVDAWPTGGLETLVKSNISLSGGANTEVSCVRNTFKIQKISGGGDDDNVLRYGDKFSLKSALDENLYIFADRIRLGDSSQSKTGISPVELVPVTGSANYGSQWIIESFDPLLRMEHEGMPVKKGEPVIIKHCSTGQNLAAIEKSTVRTPFGREIELGVRTYFNSHKAEMDNNYWIFS